MPLGYPVLQAFLELHTVGEFSALQSMHWLIHLLHITVRLQCPNIAMLGDSRGDICHSVYKIDNHAQNTFVPSLVSRYIC